MSVLGLDPTPLTPPCALQSDDGPVVGTSIVSFGFEPQFPHLNDDVFELLQEN